MQWPTILNYYSAITNGYDLCFRKKTTEKMMILQPKTLLLC